MKTIMIITCPECANTYLDHQPLEIKMIHMVEQDEPDHFVCPECGYKLAVPDSF